jgi:hypothetical protein
LAKKTKNHDFSTKGTIERKKPPKNIPKKLEVRKKT